MKKIGFKVNGINQLLLNNPQCVDPFNPYKVKQKKITNKKNKTEEDLLKLRVIEVESKLYFDDEGVFVPSNWVTNSITSNSWNLIKVKKADIRSCVLMDEPKLKLTYDGMKKVKTIQDISLNSEFVHLANLKQGQVRVSKAFPVFNDWSFEGSLSYDDRIVDKESILQVLNHAAQYGGYGDFRPTYGRAVFEEIKVN